MPDIYVVGMYDMVFIWLAGLALLIGPVFLLEKLSGRKKRKK